MGAEKREIHLSEWRFSVFPLKFVQDPLKSGAKNR